MTPSPIRIQRKRTKGWRMPENTVYVGRPTRWGNPYRVGCLGVPDAAAAVKRFRHLMRRSQKKLGEHHRLFVFSNRHLRTSLRGKNLACWCPLDQPCHADVLLEIANSGG